MSPQAFAAGGYGGRSYTREAPTTEISGDISARLAAAKSARFAAGVGGGRLRRAFAAGVGAIIGVVAQPAVAVSTHQLVN